MFKKKIVFVSGVFNVIHPGHLRLLRYAKECGDKLIVGVESDKLAKNKSHVNEALRLEGLLSNIWVDEAFVIYEKPVKIIKKMKPDVVVKGKEYENIFNEELESISKYGGKLLFSSGESNFSSVDLIRQEYGYNQYQNIIQPNAFKIRHQINDIELKNIVNNFKNLKVCIIGDLIVDEYITCDALGLSQEDPTVVVTPIDNAKFLGGAGIVAAHCAGLGADVNFFTVLGNDKEAEFAIQKLSNFGVKTSFVKDNSRPTTLKQRYRCKGKSLLRVSYLQQKDISKELQIQMLDKIMQVIDKANLIVFSDFNYGCLPQEMIDTITKIAKKNRIFIAADSQSSSQIGDISRFKDMDLLTPTEREARISTRNREDGLVILATNLQKISFSKNILLKLGAEGLLIHAGTDKKTDWLTDKVEALNRAPKDVAGAGDSLLITSAMTLATGGNIWNAALLGSIAAAIQVGRVGNTPLKAEELIKELNS